MLGARGYGIHMSIAESGAPAGPASAPERVVVRLRPHARVLFWPSLLFVIVCGAVGYFTFTVPEAWMSIAIALGGAALIILACVFPLAAWLARSMTITTRRVIVRSGLFVRSRQEMLLSRGTAITIRRSWLQTAFRTGDVSIATEERPLVLHDVPEPVLVQDTLHDLIEQSRAPQPGLHGGPPYPLA